MNLYDFDDTVFYGDSEIRFMEYVYKMYPKSRKEKKKIEFRKVLYKLHLVPLERVVEVRYEKLLPYIDNIDEFLEKFWDEHEKYLKPWYLAQKDTSDIFTSATPGFILEPIMKRLGVTNLIATKIDLEKRKIVGKSNYDKQKVVTFKERYGDIVPDAFYSDSDTDIYVARLATKAYKVKEDEINEWNVN